MIPNSVFSAVNIHGIKLLTRLCVGLSHLRELDITFRTLSIRCVLAV